MTIDELFEGIDSLPDAEQVKLLMACRSNDERMAGKILIMAYNATIRLLASDPAEGLDIPVCLKGE